MKIKKMRMEEGLLDKFHEVEAAHWWWEGRRQLLRQLLSDEVIKLIKEPKILDVGCGTGETMNFIKTLLPESEVYGVDTSKVAIKYAKSRGHTKVYLVNEKKLPFKSNCFDAILYLDVLEHILDDLSELKKVKKLLKKDGILIISCPALNILWSDHDTNQGHIKRYTSDEFRSLASALKLNVEWVGYFNFFLLPIIALFRWLSRVPGLKQLASYESSANYDVAKMGVINEILKKIFVNEVKLTKWIKYPFGVSVAVKLRK